MPHRYICDVFQEMRDADKSKNFSYMKGLIEEAQSMANRMENRLHLGKDAERLHKEVKLEPLYTVEFVEVSVSGAQVAALLKLNIALGIGLMVILLIIVSEHPVPAVTMSVML